MADRVFIEGLEVTTTIGAHKWERSAKRTVRIDVEVATDCRAAGAADDLHLTVNYSALSEVVCTCAEGSSFHLLEALAEAIAAAILAGFSSADEVHVRVAKPGAVTAALTAGVMISRTRQDGHG